MSRRAVLAIVLAATGCDRIFDLTRPPAPPDAPEEPDAPDAFVPDAQHCFGAGTLALCLVDPPVPELVVPSGTTLTLDTSPAAPLSRCAVYTGGQLDVCVVAATEFRIEGALQGVGTRPLVLVGSTVSVIGTVSVSSVTATAGAGAQPTDCVAGTAAMPIGGGGGGGSFIGRGGNGGNGNGTNNGGNSSVPIMSVTRLRGGCAGRAGDQGFGTIGRGGGAVAIVAATLTVEGTINASGSNGLGGPTAVAATGRGAGGGGSGGMIVIDATSFVIGPAGKVFANGAGGGEGGGNPNAGMHGQNPADPLIAAAGGDNATAGGGAGGAGSVGATLEGAIGRNGNATSGGGGGGGGAGLIRFVTQPTGPVERISPPPT